MNVKNIVAIEISNWFLLYLFNHRTVYDPYKLAFLSITNEKYKFYIYEQPKYHIFYESQSWHHCWFTFSFHNTARKCIFEMASDESKKSVNAGLLKHRWFWTFFYWRVSDSTLFFMSFLELLTPKTTALGYKWKFMTNESKLSFC